MAFSYLSLYLVRVADSTVCNHVSCLALRAVCKQSAITLGTNITEINATYPGSLESWPHALLRGLFGAGCELRMHAPGRVHRLVYGHPLLQRGHSHRGRFELDSSEIVSIVLNAKYRKNEKLTIKTQTLNSNMN